jgi:hypothetical protein
MSLEATPNFRTVQFVINNTQHDDRQNVLRCGRN